MTSVTFMKSVAQVEDRFVIVGWSVELGNLDYYLLLKYVSLHFSSVLSQFWFNISKKKFPFFCTFFFEDLHPTVFGQLWQPIVRWIMWNLLPGVMIKSFLLNVRSLFNFFLFVYSNTGVSSKPPLEAVISTLFFSISFSITSQHSAPWNLCNRIGLQKACS